MRNLIWTSFPKLKKAFFLSPHTQKLIRTYALAETVGRKTRLAASASVSVLLPTTCSYTLR